MIARRRARPPLSPAPWACILALLACSSRGSSDCATSACLPAAVPYCTRYCADGVCPTGLRCVAHPNAFDGTRLATCER